MEKERNAQGNSANKVLHTGKDPEPAQAVIPIIEEQITIGKKVIETGTVEVTRHVFEHTEPVHVVTSHDECHVERVPAGYMVETAPAVRWEGDTMIIPVLREVAVIEKRLMLVEELHVTTTKVQTQETQQVTLRTEGLTVTRKPADPTDQRP